MRGISFDLRTFRLDMSSFLCDKELYSNSYYGDRAHIIVSGQQGIKIKKPTQMVSVRVDNEY